MSFAVIKTGGKQYNVAEGDRIEIEKLENEAGRPAQAGTEIVFDQVLLVGNSSAENTKIGTPLVNGARVTAKVLEQGRGDKKIVFKFHHKTRYKKKKGHRQPFTKIEILNIAM